MLIPQKYQSVLHPTALAEIEYRLAVDFFEAPRQGCLSKRYVSSNLWNGQWGAGLLSDQTARCL